jgi:hypothetical protein
MIAKGVRFNAEKKQVGNYYSTKVHDWLLDNFYLHCYAQHKRTSIFFFNWLVFADCDKSAEFPLA